MFPTTQCADPTHTFNFIYIVQAGSTCIAVHGALHVCGLELTALHYDGAGRRDGALCNVEAVMVVLAEAEDYGDAGFSCCRADLVHFFRVIRKRIFDIFGCQRWV